MTKRHKGKMRPAHIVVEGTTWCQHELFDSEIHRCNHLSRYSAKKHLQHMIDFLGVDSDFTAIVTGDCPNCKQIEEGLR